MGSALILLAAGAAAGLPPSRRHVPAAVIKAVEGCWQVTPDEQITIRRRGSDGLESKSKFTPESIRPLNRVGYSWEEAFYYPDPGGLQIACGQTSQHGQFCFVRPVDDKLEVQLWTRGYDFPRTKALRSTTQVSRCASQPHQRRVSPAAP